MNDVEPTPLPVAHARHDRAWRSNAFCYPVVSRRGGGLSIGVNLNPDKACNFDCVYCQVDRTTPPAVRKVDLDLVRAELEDLVDRASDGTIFTEAPFDAVPPDARAVRDIAFSGDGEPTAFPRFDEAVQLAADVRRQRKLTDAKIIVITDACYLTKPRVRRGLEIMDAHNGEIWAKLDAGTEDYYRAVNRPNYPLSHVIENIIDAARARPVVIQSLWMRLHGEPPAEAEVSAFVERLEEIIAAGGRIKLVQVYTIARQTTEAYATALSREELERVSNVVSSKSQIPVSTYPGAADSA